MKYKIGRLVGRFIRETGLYSLFYQLAIFCKFKNSDAYRVMTTSETLDYINERKVSFVRLGEGEFRMLTIEGGYNIRFQQTSDKLSERLRELLDINDQGLLICIPFPFSFKFYPYNKKARVFWTWHVYETLPALMKILPKNRRYGDALITRLYIDYQDRSHSRLLFEKIKMLWDKADVVIVEGALTRFGVGNDLLKNANSVRRILVPSTNAFDFYDQILKASLKEDKGCLFLLSIGPTAKVLALDLHRAGFRVFDVGHLDLEYEWYKVGADWKQPVPGKYFNEAERECDIYSGRLNEKDNEKYLSEIVEKIGEG